MEQLAMTEYVNLNLCHIGWKNWKRGDICVLRSVDGYLSCLRIQNQSAYKEWSGCFSII
jgi:hypothetical protein